MSRFRNAWRALTESGKRIVPRSSNSLRRFSSGEFAGVTSTSSNFNSFTYGYGNNLQLLQHLPRLREVARQLYCESPVVQSAVSGVRTNLVLPDNSSGVNFRAKFAVTGDLNREISSYLNTWAAGAVDVNGGSLGDILDVMVWHLVIDGECILRRHLVDGAIRLEVVDPLRCPTSVAITSGNRTAGQILDPETGKVLVYRIVSRSDAANMNVGGAGNSAKVLIDVPADDIYHIFPREFADQTRGIPPLRQSFQNIEDLRRYQTLELKAAAKNAEDGTFFTTTVAQAANEIEDMQVAGGDMDGEDSAGGIVTSSVIGNIAAKAGDYPILSPGITPYAGSATHPTGNYPAFIKAVMASIAMNIGIPPSMITGDFTGTYSAAHFTAQSFKDRFLKRQGEVKRLFLLPVIRSVLSTSSFALRENVTQETVNIQLKRFTFLDPKKQAANDLGRIKQGLISTQELAEESGANFRENVKKQAEDLEFLKETSPEMYEVALRNYGLGAPSPMEAGNES